MVVGVSQIPSVTPASVPADAYLLDVREPDEWQAGRIAQAHHLPMMEIPARLAEIPRDGDVVVVCRSGGRSGQVVAYLGQQGWDNVFNLVGGMQSWAATGLPMVADDDRPAIVI